MKLVELAEKRYSCRAYRSDEVEREKLEYIMECVRLSPSAVNKQPWLFRIVSCDEEWVRADGKRHGDIDIAIAVEHLCLAATEQGLGTCWVCNFDAALCKQLFGMGDNEEPAVLIPLGYAADEPKEKRRKALGEIVR